MTRQQAMDTTRKYEGCRTESYLDSLGNRTIGIGHLQVAGDNRKQITEARAVRMFEEEDFPAAVRHVIVMLLDPAVRCDLSTPEARAAYNDACARAKARSEEAARQWAADEIESRYYALFDTGFNAGHRLDRFRGMRRAITDGDWFRAGDELLFVDPDAQVLVPTPYANQVGNRARDNAYRLRTNSEPEAVRMPPQGRALDRPVIGGAK